MARLDEPAQARGRLRHRLVERFGYRAENT
jgi:hypothetical protein